MKKLLLLLAALSVSMGAAAVQASKGAAKPPHKAASAPAAGASAPAASASAPGAREARASAWASKQRSAKMAACRKEAADKGLRDVELKTAIVACANQ